MITITKTKELDKNRIKLTWHEDDKKIKHLYIPVHMYAREDSLSYYLNNCGYHGYSKTVFEMEFSVPVEIK